MLQEVCDLDAGALEQIIIGMIGDALDYDSDGLVQVTKEGSEVHTRIDGPCHQIVPQLEGKSPPHPYQASCHLE